MKHLAWLLALFFLIALALRVGVAIRLPSIEWPDEIVETLEPAHHLAYGYGIVTWEFRRGIRSWMFPAFLAGVMRATDWMGPGSLGYIRAITIVLSLLSLTTAWFGYAWGKRAGGDAAAIIAAGTCAIWYGLVYFAPKAFTEVVAGNLLLPGLYFGMYGDALPEKRRLFLAGLFCGLAVSLRMQLAPAVAFAAIYFCIPNWKKRGPVLAAGLLLPVVVFGLVDAITWSYPFQSYIRYLWVNFGERRSLMYGTEPWYWYLTSLVRLLGPMLLLALAGVRRSPFLGWVAFIIIASHSLLAHKEARFLYPVIPILLTLAALGLTEIARALNARLKSPLSPKTIVTVSLVFCTLTSALCAWRFPRWGYESGNLIAMEQLSLDSSVCGVGLYKISWAHNGGYSRLHQNVPLILVTQDNELEQQMPSFNALLTVGHLADPKMGFELTKYWNGVYLYRRPGSCMSSPQYNEVNRILRETDR